MYPRNIRVELEYEHSSIFTLPPRRINKGIKIEHELIEVLAVLF